MDKTKMEQEKESTKPRKEPTVCMPYYMHRITGETIEFHSQQKTHTFPAMTNPVLINRQRRTEATLEKYKEMYEQGGAQLRVSIFEEEETITKPDIVRWDFMEFQAKSGLFLVAYHLRKSKKKKGRRVGAWFKGQNTIYEIVSFKTLTDKMTKLTGIPTGHSIQFDRNNLNIRLFGKNANKDKKGRWIPV